MAYNIVWFCDRLGSANYARRCRPSTGPSGSEPSSIARGAFVAPILTFYLTRHRGLSLGEAGSIIALFGAGTVVASLVGGALADRLGRKITMVGSLFGGACAMLWVSASSSLWMLAASVLVLGSSAISTVPRSMRSSPTSCRPSIASARTDSCTGRSTWDFSIAPVAAGAVATFSYRALFIGDAATSALFSLVVLARVPRDPSRSDAAELEGVQLQRSSFRDRTFMWFWLMAMLQACIIFQLTVTLSGWMQLQGYGPGVYGAVLSINGILIVLFQPALTEWTKQFDRRRVLAWAALLMGAGFALHGVSSLIAVHACAVAVWTLGEIFNSPTASSLRRGSRTAARARPLRRVLRDGLGPRVVPRADLGPRVLAESPALLWGGCAGLGVICAIGYRAMRDVPRGVSWAGERDAARCAGRRGPRRGRAAVEVDGHRRATEEVMRERAGRARADALRQRQHRSTAPPMRSRS